jgi:hypothetical protein
MTNILIHYSVIPGSCEENIQLIKLFLQQLCARSQPGVTHRVFKCGKTAFIHLCRYDDTKMLEEATQLASFQLFVENLKNIMVDEPITNNITEIGHYAQ